MKQHVDAEVVILDRIMYLLEEGSVSHVAQQDEKFQTFIRDLYQRLNDHSQHLQANTA